MKVPHTGAGDIDVYVYIHCVCLKQWLRVRAGSEISSGVLRLRRVSALHSVCKNEDVKSTNEAFP